MARHIHVVGAVVTQDGLVLCAQRGQGGSLPGLWEFPGGKIEPGELPRAALEREIAEELECSVQVGEMIATTSHEYHFGTVTLMTFYCRILEGTPHPTEHASIMWLPPDQLNDLPWAPADLPTVMQVQADHS